MPRPLTLDSANRLSEGAPAEAVADPASTSSADVHDTVVALLASLRAAGYLAVAGNTPPTAAFTFAVDGLSVAFTDASTDSDGTIVARAWQFGDGGTSTATNPSHTYAEAGTYTVTLTVTDDGGATDDVEHDVAVEEAAGPQIFVAKNAMRYPEDDPYSATPNTELPAPTQAGDMLIFAVAVTARGPVLYGSTGLEEIEVIGPGGGDQMFVSKMTCTGSETGPIQVTLQDGPGDWFAMSILIRGAGEYRSIDPKFVAVGNITTGNPVPIAGLADVHVPAGRTALWLGSLSTFGAASGTVSAVTLPDGFSEEDRIVDNVCEALLCASRTFDEAETDTYSGAVTFTGQDYFKSFAALLQFGGAAPVEMTLDGTLPGTATVGVPYSGELTVSGDYADPVTPGVAAGSLPSWLSPNYADGVITYSGTPDESGAVAFTPNATDAHSQVAVGDEQTIVVSEASGSVGVAQNTGIRKFLPASGASTITPDAPFAAGNTVIVPIAVYNTNNIDLATSLAVTINGVAASCAVRRNNDQIGGAIFYGTAGSGSAGVQISFTSSPAEAGTYFIAGAIECDDLDGFDQPGTNNGSGGGNVTVTTGATAQANERVVALVTTGNNLIVPMTIDGADTLIFSDTDGQNEVPATAAYRDVTASGAQTITWTKGANSSWGMIAATFKRTA